MLAQDKTFGFSVPGSNTTIEISTEGLREILGQVEAELYRSEVYRRALTNLQQMPSKGAESVQFLMKAIGREAIRLTLRNFVHTAVTPEPSRTTDDRDGDDFPVAAFSRALGSRVTVLPTAPEPTPQAIAASEPSAPIPQKMPFVQTLLQHPVAIAAKVNSQKTSKRLSPAEAAAQVAQDRHTALQQIGTQIRTKREQRSMSLSQLHNKNSRAHASATGPRIRLWQPSARRCLPARLYQTC
ncbi:MAG: hypothetical protein HC780_18445 [Leptolyngbyaceae cyanobacterium CSU_1_3]|nr:hypothetical protein [Leptolyngbyaceae cyanobacterium CSU_1_3]